MCLGTEGKENEMKEEIRNAKKNQIIEEKRGNNLGLFIWNKKWIR